MDLAIHATTRFNNQEYTPLSPSSPPKNLFDKILKILDNVAASYNYDALRRIPSSNILGQIFSCGFIDDNQVKTVLGYYSYDLLRNVRFTWPQDAPFVKWLFGLVNTSYRKVALDKETKEGLFTNLTVIPNVTPGRLSDSLVLEPASAPPAVRGRKAVTAKPAKKIHLRDWRFREGSSGTDEMHLIDIKIEELAKHGAIASWVTEEDAHRRFRSGLWNFWDRQGGREMAIVKRGGAVTENTKYLIYSILDSSLDDSEYYVEWVGYGKSYCTWEPESGIPGELLRDYRRKRLRCVRKGMEGWG